MPEPNPKCIKCIGKEQAEYYMTVPHNALTDEICDHCGEWNNCPQNSEE